MEIYENKIHLTIRQGDLHVNTEHINDDNQQTLSLSFGRWFKGDVGPIGPPGLDGNDGKDAQINGRNAIVIAAGENISITDIEDGIQIAANGGALFLAEVNEAGTQLITPFDDILEAYNNGNVVYLKIPFFGVFVLAPLVAINNDLNMIMFDAHLATPDIHLDGALACTSDGQVEFQMYLPNWNNIQNKPTKLSEFENDTQFITEQSLEGYATESWVTKQHYLTEHQDISGKVDRSDLATVATTGNYNDLSNKPTIPSLDDLVTQQELQDGLDNKVDKVAGKQLSENDFSNSWKNKLVGIQNGAQVNVIETVQVNNQTLTPSNKTVNIAVPTKTSDLTNDSNFLTSHQSLSGYATENWVENKGYLTQHQDISNKADKSEIPTKISQLNNDSNFIKNTVNNLTNYYTKTNTYTKSEVEGLIAAINQFHYEIVTVLPTTGEGNVLYLKGPIGDGSDKYEEYVYANGTFVKIGDTSIDLSGYAKLEDIPNTSDFVRTSELNTKQDKINDLDTIRNGASKGSTALQSISSTDVVNALGYTPYNSSNPNGYTNNKGTVTKVNNISPDTNGNVTITLPDGGTTDYNQLLNKPVLNVAWNDVIAENWGNYFILYERGEAFIITSSYSAGIISWDEGVVKTYHCNNSAQFIGKTYSELLAGLWNNYATPIAKTTDIPTKTSELTNDAGFLQSFTETDPTVPAWAKASSKPTYTASEVGARPSTWTPTKSDVGLGNVGNFKAVSTTANQGLTTTEKSNARDNINAQETLISGTNIKTINGETILGNGNITIAGGGATEEIYIGTDEPVDPNVKMWVVPTGDLDSLVTLSEVEQLIDNKLNDVLNELY